MMLRESNGHKQKPQSDLTVSALLKKGFHAVTDAIQAGKPFREFRIECIMRTAF